MRGVHENMERCKMFEQVWITWHRRGEALCPGQKVHFTITLIFLISWRQKKAILPFQEGYFWIIWDRRSCFSLTHLCHCVRFSVLSNLCKQPWSFTLPQPIVVIYVPVLCPLTKEESSSWSSWSASIIVTHFQIFGSNGNSIIMMGRVINYSVTGKSNAVSNAVNYNAVNYNAVNYNAIIPITGKL